MQTGIRKDVDRVKKLKITVNGHAYDVTVVEESKHEPSRAEAPKPAPVPAPASRPAPAPVPEPKPEPAPKRPVSGDGHQVEAPLAGSIRSVVVKVGDTVKEGDLLVTLEALKLENEIVSPVAGRVTAVSVTTGDEVGAGQSLVTIAT